MSFLSLAAGCQPGGSRFLLLRFPSLAVEVDHAPGPQFHAHAEGEGRNYFDAGTKLDGIYDLTLLNKVLKAAGKPEVHS